MTTAKSPIRVLKAQAKHVAATLKAAERGKPIPADRDGKIAAARESESVIFGVVMDDRILKIEMTWEAIRRTSKAGIAQYILDQMREERRTVH